MALTSQQAAPMPEATQRVAQPALLPAPRAATVTENLEGLCFRVSPQFRKRFRQRAVEADLKLNELLFEALDAWERGRGLQS